MPTVDRKQARGECYRDGVHSVFYKFATHPVSTEHRIPADERCELSPVRLPFAFVTSLIKFHIGTLESVGLLAVCSP